MSEKDVHLEPEEGLQDVEAHQNLNQNLNKDEDDVEAHQNLNQNLNKDEDDVEAHQNLNRNQGKDDDDDVEGHVNLN